MSNDFNIPARPLDENGFDPAVVAIFGDVLPASVLKLLSNDPLSPMSDEVREKVMADAYAAGRFYTEKLAEYRDGAQFSEAQVAVATIASDALGSFILMLECGKALHADGDPSKIIAMDTAVALWEQGKVRLEWTFEDFDNGQTQCGVRFVETDKDESNEEG